MRRASTAAAITAAGIFACSSFESDGGNTPPQDAGVDQVTSAPEAAAPDVVVTSPPDTLGAVTYDRRDDFERDDIPGAGPLAWAEEAPNTTAASVISAGLCESDPHCSPTRSALITHDSAGAGYLATTLDEHTRNLRFDFAMKVSRTNADVGRVRVASIELAEGRVIFLQISGNEIQLGDATSTNDESPGTADLGTFEFDRWARYRLYVNLDDRVAALARDGESLATTLTIRPEVVKTMARARLGITLVGGNQFTVHYDDVGIRELPKL